MSQEQSRSQSETLQDFIGRLTTGDSEPIPADETWEQMIQRINVAGRIHRITEEVFDYFLEVLPPRWMRGNHFAFAEGADPLQLFWSRRAQSAQSDEHFTRQLLALEIDQFCHLTRVPRNYGGYYGSEF
jgi:hypothetical protein